jgi:hypothetical protein
MLKQVFCWREVIAMLIAVEKSMVRRRVGKSIVFGWLLILRRKSGNVDAEVEVDTVDTCGEKADLYSEERDYHNPRKRILVPEELQ